MKRDTHGEFPIRARPPAERIAPTRCVHAFPSFSLPFFFFQENVTQAPNARARPSQRLSFFSKRFSTRPRDCRAVSPRASSSPREGGEKIRRSRGNGQGVCVYARALCVCARATRQERSCCHPSGLIMHRGQPRGNLADAVKTVVLCAYTGVHARLDPHVRNVLYVRWRTAGR